MRILFLTDNFPPEFNAPATRTFEHCKEWVKKGAEVTVITGTPNFPTGKVFDGYKNKIKQEEYIEGIKVIRVWSYIAANEGTLKRTLDYISFAITSFIAGLTVKTDIIVATSPQFFTAISGCVLSFFKRKQWIMEVRDIWPESIRAVEAVKSNWIISALEKLELFLYKRAKKIVVVTDSFKENLSARGVSINKIAVIKNGVDLSAYRPRHADETIIDTYGLRNKFVVGYIGTHGLAHGLQFIVQCISKIKDDSFHFLFIGDGAEKNNVVSLAGELNLKNVTFIAPVKKTEIQNYLSVINVALVPLRKSTTFESVIPSKVFESVALGIPILLGVNGETRRIIEHYRAGVFFEPENEMDFLEKIQDIRGKLEKDRNYFREGCLNMANDFNRNTQAIRMLEVIGESTTAN